MKTHKFCSQCRHENRISAKFCMHCGKAFKRFIIKSQDTDYCPSCYTARHEGAKFCRICGYSFVSQPTEPPVNQPVVPALELPPPALIPAPIAPPPTVAKQDPIEPSASSQETENGILISQTELAQLRRAKTEQILFIPRKKPKT